MTHFAPELPIFAGETKQSMFHDWDLSQEGFDRLLAWLHPNREEAAHKYEAIRQRVRKTIAARGCGAAAEIFDEAVYRITHKLPDLLLDYDGDPALYFYGVANLVYLEYVRKQPAAEELRPTFAAPDPIDIEPAYKCLEKCLNELLPADREILLRFYRENKQAKIDDRKELAKELGVTENALRLRMFRLRQKLAECITKCREKE